MLTALTEGLLDSSSVFTVELLVFSWRLEMIQEMKKQKAFVPHQDLQAIKCPLLLLLC